MVLNITEIINIEELKKHKQELNEWNEYVPLLLIGFLDDDYFKRMNDNANIKYQQMRQGLPGNPPDVDDYLLKDILDWVKKYPQFKNILK